MPNITTNHAIAYTNHTSDKQKSDDRVAGVQVF